MARTGYQFETSPRKLEPSYNPRKRNRMHIVKEAQPSNKKHSLDNKKKVKLTLAIVGVFAVLLTISYRNSLINEKFNKVQSQKRQLSMIQKENEQLKVNIENSLNNNYIEQQAKERLGMKKLTNKQTVYITLPKKDYVESPAERVSIDEDDSKNWIESIFSGFAD
ncbi:MAG: cell division protein FtsL [Clostridia bacterium]|nr:cell division protein FtsL [Clostridia bacterium]